MAQIPYADLAAPALQPLVQRIVAERGQVLHLYQMLMHSPPLAEGWLHFMTRVRQQLALDGALRELVIMRIAHLNGAPYEAEQHAPIACAKGWRRPSSTPCPTGTGAGRHLQRAAGRCAAPVRRHDTRHPRAAAAAAGRAGALGDRRLVELVGTIASYNMVSRFLEALQIHGDDPRPPAPA
jgi:alkylhydroperoxidase family enzyme